MEARGSDTPDRAAVDGAAARTILIVDDDDGHRSMLARTLAEVGFHVATAVHGADALAQLRAGMHPDLILLDLQMPEVDGWTFMVTQKREPALASIPIVVFTGHGERALNSAPIAAGYLTKPIDRRALLETVDSILVRTAARVSSAMPPPEPGAPPEG